MLCEERVAWSADIHQSKDTVSQVNLSLTHFIENIRVPTFSVPKTKYNVVPYGDHGTERGKVELRGDFTLMKYVMYKNTNVSICIIFYLFYGESRHQSAMQYMSIIILNVFVTVHLQISTVHLQTPRVVLLSDIIRLQFTTSYREDPL